MRLPDPFIDPSWPGVTSCQLSDVSSYQQDELNDNIDNYFDVIKESLYNNQIKKLTSELKNESNSVKKIEIAQRIVDLKMKESNKDE